MINLANQPIRESLLGKGLAYPLSTAPSGDIAGAKEEDNVKRCLGLLFDVVVGERVMNEDFGIDAQELLFDNQEIVAEVAPLKLSDAITLYERRVVRVSIAADRIGKSTKLNIKYSIRATGLSQDTTWDPETLGRR